VLVPTAQASGKTITHDAISECQKSPLITRKNQVDNRVTKVNLFVLVYLRTRFRAVGTVLKAQADFRRNEAWVTYTILDPGSEGAVPEDMFLRHFYDDCYVWE
jgi:hypothetical protein